MVLLCGLQIGLLLHSLDFENRSFKKSDLTQSRVYRPQAISFGSKPTVIFVGVDLDAQVGLSKSKGLKIGSYQWQNDLLTIIHDATEIIIFDPTERPVVVSNPGKAKNVYSSLDERQEVLEALSKGSKIVWKLTNVGPEGCLNQFARLYWGSSNERTEDKMEPSWEHCISSQSYLTGLSSSQRALATAFTFACSEFSDTKEVSIILSKRMIERDATNPIAWWYLSQLDNTSLSGRMDLDWQNQLRKIQARMGKWKIGKAFLAKRFKESH